MKRVTTSLFAILVAILLTTFISSCSKKEPEAEPTQGTTQTKLELLTGNNWILTAFFLDDENKFKDIPTCEYDNINKYLPNSDYLYDVGIAKCGTESQIRTIAGWEFTDNETAIKRSDAFNVDIVELNSTTLITEEKRQNGVTARYEYKAVPTFTNMLAAGKWKLVGLNSNGTDIYNNLPACKKDNLISFKANGEYTEEEGATKCNTSASETLVNSTWYIFAYERELTANKTTYNIREFSETRIELERRDTTYIYTKQ